MELRALQGLSAAPEPVVTAFSAWPLIRRVAASTAICWVKRVRATGSAAPDRMGGRCPRKIAGEHREWLVARCKARDFTLRGLVSELAERGLRVDYRTMWAFVHAEKLSFKNVWPARLQAASSI